MDYNLTISVKASPQHAFDCINDVQGWWTENLTGKSVKLNDEFTVKFGDVHLSTQRLVECVPGKKVVWLVTSSRLNFIENTGEWTGTRISFEIISNNDKTELCFTHHGLQPNVECYEACSNAWGPYIQQSLKSLINTGKGNPTKKDL